MTDSARPFLVMYIVWHPDFPLGEKVAKALFDHFRRDNYKNVTGGVGLSVVYRFAPASDSDEPLAIDFSAAETSAVVVLADKNFCDDPKWISFISTVAGQTKEQGLSARLFPVAMEDGVLQTLQLKEQALHWHTWKGQFDEIAAQLAGHLTYQFCRMLRYYLEHLRHPGVTREEIRRYLKKVDVFLSHSKHDDDGTGERTVEAIRKKLSDRDGLDSFFDVYDIPPGLDYEEVLLSKIEVSAVIAIHTDTFSSREWCRREIIEAKRHNRPLVIANCIADKDQRGFPYMGNVPIVRLDEKNKRRVDVVIRALLDEILKDFLWRCRIELMQSSLTTTVTFLSRPPELILLAGIIPAANGEKRIIVYPDPPLGAEEERLFHDIAPNIQLRSATEWMAGAVR